MQYPLASLTCIGVAVPQDSIFLSVTSFLSAKDTFPIRALFRTKRMCNQHVIGAGIMVRISPNLNLDNHYKPTYRGQTPSFDSAFIARKLHKTVLESFCGD